MAKYLMKVIVISDDLRNSDYIKEPNWLVVDPDKVNEIRLFNKSYIQAVKCKDCKYMTEHYDTDGNVPYWTCSEWDSGTDYDGYCHYGERKDEVENG